MSLPDDAFHGLVHPDVRAYLDGLGGADDPLVLALEAYALERGFPLVGRSSGRWLELLARSVGAKRVFEFGSGFGFSAFYFARAVGEGGAVYGMDRDAHELEAHARLYAGHPFASRVHLVQGDALEVWRDTPGDFDVVFLDLDKASYGAALDAALPRLRPGGLLLADNVLWGGRVTRPSAEDDHSTRALQAFNQRIFSDPRLQTAILPVGDGLAVALRLPD